MFNFLNGSILNQDDFILEDRKADLSTLYKTENL